MSEVLGFLVALFMIGSSLYVLGLGVRYLWRHPSEWTRRILSGLFVLATVAAAVFAAGLTLSLIDAARHFWREVLF